MWIMTRVGWRRIGGNPPVPQGPRHDWPSPIYKGSGEDRASWEAQQQETVAALHRNWLAADEAIWGHGRAVTRRQFDAGRAAR